MTFYLSEKTRNELRRSQPTLEQYERDLRHAFANSLARREDDFGLLVTAETAASRLFAFLTEQGSHAIKLGHLHRLDLHRAEHRVHGIDDDRYSRFGNAIVPVLRDTLGDQLSSDALAAWSDTFWAAVHQIRDQDPDHARVQPACQLTLT